MKKLLTLVALILGTYAAFGQLKIENKFDNELIMIGNISGGAFLNATNTITNGPGSAPRVAEHRVYCRIFDGKTTYGLLVDTQNRFDDDFEFALGLTVDSAVKSVNDLIDLVTNSDAGTSYTVTDEDERKIQLNIERRKILSIKAIDAQGKVICDEVQLNLNNLNRAKELLLTKAEWKVERTLKKNKAH